CRSRRPRRPPRGGLDALAVPGDAARRRARDADADQAGARPGERDEPGQARLPGRGGDSVRRGSVGGVSSPDQTGTLQRGDALREHYLTLLKQALTRSEGRAYAPQRSWARAAAAPLQWALGRAELEIVHREDG